MNDKKPKISVVLPVYNGMKYLEKSVMSVLNQDLDDFEFLICDDCSTDDSFNYLQKLNSDKIKLFRNETNKGLFPTLNFLIKHTNSELIHLWAQDDIMLPECLSETIKFHDKFPDVNFSFSRWFTIDQNDEIIDKGFEIEDHTISPKGHAKSSILYGSIAGNIANVTVVKKAVENVGYFDETMKYSGDFDMWYKLSVNNYVGLSSAYLIKMRRHSGQLSKNIDASFFKLSENLQIYKNFLSHFTDKELKIAKRALKWKIYTQFYNQKLFIKKSKNKSLYRNYSDKLNEYDNSTLLFLRWLIVRYLKMFRLEQKFYNSFIISKM